MHLRFSRDVLDFGFMLRMLTREGFLGLPVFAASEGLTSTNSFFRISGSLGHRHQVTDNGLRGSNAIYPSPVSLSLK